MFLLTAPFLFSQDNFSLTLRKAERRVSIDEIAMHSLRGVERRSNLMNVPRIDETRSLTLFTRKELWADSLKSDSSFTSITPKKETSKKFHMKKSSLTAVLLSAVVPGAGQFYNESYWKIPIIAGLVGYFGYEYFRQNNLYKDYRDDYLASQTPENPDGNLSLKTFREFYRNQRDDFVWYFLIVYTVNLIDAYVGAHLFDFDVREEKGNGKTDKSYRLKFNLNF